MDRQNYQDYNSPSQLSTLSWVMLLFFFWLAIYIPGLGELEMKGEETRRAIPAQNMLRTGDFVVMTIGGEVYNRKPPGISWAVAAVMGISGRQDEWAARLPSVLAMLMLGLGTFFLLRSMLKPRGAFLCAMMQLTAVGLAEKGRLIEIEALFTAFVALAMLSWAVYFVDGQKKWRLWLLPSILMGAAMLTKGPVAIIFYLVMVIFVLKADGTWREQVRGLPFWAGIGIMWGMFLAWAIPNAILSARMINESGAKGEGNEGMLEVFRVWIKEIAVRFIPSDLLAWIEVPIEGLTNFLPWAPLLYFLWRQKIPNHPEEVEKEPWKALFLGSRRALAVGFLAIALLPASQGRYTLPFIGLASLLVCMQWMYPRAEPYLTRKILNVCTIVLMVIYTGLLVAPFVVPWYSHFKGIGMYPGSDWAVIIMGMSAVAVLDRKSVV